MPQLCLKCAHPIEEHKIEIVGNYDFVEINCKEYDDNGENCNCDAGFGKVSIKKEFSQMK
jgi:hypothetical protein